MSNIIYKTIKDNIKRGKLSIQEFEDIVLNYTIYNLKKSEIRNLLSLFEKESLSKVALIERETLPEVKKKIQLEFGVNEIIVKDNNSNLDQSIQIGDTIYKFKVKDKLGTLKR